VEKKEESIDETVLPVDDFLFDNPFYDAIAIWESEELSIPALVRLASPSIKASRQNNM